MTPAEEIAKAIATAGHGTFGGNSGWSINVNVEPDLPADAVTVYDTGGAELDTEQFDLSRGSFQVRVRAVDPQLGIAKHYAVRQFLVHTTPIGSVLGAFLTSDILSLGRDARNNYITVSNYRAIRQES